MAAGKRIILTGQSGLQSESAITHFLTHFAKFQDITPPRYFKLETFLKQVYAKAKGIDAKKEDIWSDILMEPIPHIYKWWKEAFELFLEVVKANPENDYILNLHACWYHHDTLEYLALPNFGLIKEFDPSIVVTLIDDIYDIQLRLKQEGQFLESKSYDKPDEMIKTALQILDWRSKEILVSRHIAKEFGIRHYVFAIKHKQQTLFDLLYTNKQRVYLSHPISEVRRLEAAGKAEQAEKIKTEIAEISKQLEKIYVPLLPTTIDELRILKKDGEFTYGLTPRWDEELYNGRNTEILFLKPDNKSTKAYFGEVELNDKQEEVYQELIKAFFDRIAKQVSSRDKKMVEQCEVLFVYRPCFNGNMSNGVLAEINYYHKLMEESPDAKVCLIYCPKKDQDDLKITAIENEIKKFFKLNTFKFTDDQKKELLAKYSDEASVARLIKTYLAFHNLDISKGWQVLEPDPSRTEHDQILEFIDSSKRLFNVWINEKYKSKATDGLFFEEDDLTPAQLVSKIEKAINSQNETANRQKEIV